MAFKLTKAKIDSATYQGDGKSRHVLWDLDIAGFGCRIYPNNRKAFIFSYRHQGRKRLFTIGPFGIMTLEQARKKALELKLSSIEGIDPLASREAVNEMLSFNQFAPIYMDRYAKSEKKSWEEDQNRIERFLSPKWGTLKLSSIKREDVANLHSDITVKSKTVANRVLSLISKMFNVAIDLGFLPEGSQNPAKGVKKAKEISRERWLTQKEMESLIIAVKNYEDIFARSALLFLIYVPVRKNEALNLKWSQIDFAGKQITFPKTKNERPLTLFLTPETEAILKNIPRIHGNPYVFCGKKDGSRLVDIKRPWDAIRSTVGFSKKTKNPEDAVTLHDLRRTFGSYAAQDGTSLQTIGAVLNHKDLSITEVYSRLSSQQSREALIEHSKRLAKIMGNA